MAADPHARPAAEVTDDLDVGEDGLARAEASRRLDEHGPNEIAAGGGRSALSILLAQFDSVLIGG